MTRLQEGNMQSTGHDDRALQMAAQKLDQMTN